MTAETEGAAVERAQQVPSASPIGRSPVLGEPRVATLHRQGRRAQMRLGRRRRVIGARLDSADTGWLNRSVDVLDVTEVPLTGRAMRHLLLDIAATGTLLTASGTHRARLAQALQCTGVEPVDLTTTVVDPLTWEVASVRNRRAALRQQHPTWRDHPVSVVLVTRRPDFLPRILGMIADQTQPCEVIVGTHGFSADPGQLSEQARDVPIQTFSFDSDQTLGTGLTRASRLATTDLLCKFDDDDFYSPTHLEDLVAAKHYSGADLVGGPQSWVYLADDDVTVRRPLGGRTGKPESFGDWVAGGTILVGRDTAEQVGYFSDLPRAVDVYLFGEVLRCGGSVYRNNSLGYVYVRAGTGHTYQVDSTKYYDRAIGQYPGLLAHPELGTGGQRPDADPIAVGGAATDVDDWRNPVAVTLRARLAKPVLHCWTPDSADLRPLAVDDPRITEHPGEAMLVRWDPRARTAVADRATLARAQQALAAEPSIGPLAALGAAGAWVIDHQSRGLEPGMHAEPLDTGPLAACGEATLTLRGATAQTNPPAHVPTGASHPDDAQQRPLPRPATAPHDDPGIRELVEQAQREHHAALIGTGLRAGVTVYNNRAVARAAALAQSEEPAHVWAESLVEAGQVDVLHSHLAHVGRVWLAGPLHLPEEPAPITGHERSGSGSSGPAGAVASRLREVAAELRAAPPGHRIAAVREQTALLAGALWRRSGARFGS